MDLFNIKTNEVELEVSQLLELINVSLKPLAVTVKGEISSFNIRDSTVFFTLADPNDDALIDCIVWRSVYNSLGIDLKEGTEVKIYGEPSVYKKNGRLRFIASSIIPTGEGELKKAFEQMMKRLSELGYFAPERKQKLPSFAKRIGLITADNSDAQKDFLTHLGKYGYEVFFYDVKVEGNKAVSEITKAIKYFNESMLELDVLVITRGGGSLESLFAYNSEEVAKAIYASKIPVLSAVGHENDVTIADLVSDIRASTPTHAGKILSEFMDYAVQSLDTSGKDMLWNFSNKLQAIQSRLSQGFLVNSSRLGTLIQMYNRQLATSSKYLIHAYENELKSITTKLELYDQLIETHSPSNILRKGYTITRTSSGKIVRSSTAMEQEDILVTEFSDGKITSKVI